MRAISILLLFPLTTLLAQELPTVGETIEVSVVNLDVVVTDKQGNRVRGLTAADFEVLENGRSQRISNFTEYAGGDSAAEQETPAARSSEASGALARQPRTVILFIEKARLQSWEAEDFFEGLKSLLRETLGPGDRATILWWDHALRVRQEFTGDLGQLARTLDSLQQETLYFNTAELDDLGARQNRMDEQDRWEILNADLPGRGVSINDFGSQYARMLARMAYSQIKAKVGALKSAINATAGFEGRKVLILGTRRLSEYAGAEFFGGTVPNELKSELSTHALRKDLAEHANAAGVTIYGFYPKGLPPEFDSNAAVSRSTIASFSFERDVQRFAAPQLILINEMVSLEDLAQQTGGLSTWGTKEIAKLLPRVQDDLQSYYSIGYRVPPGQDKRVRNIRVRTRNRDYQVRSRRQYIEKDDEEAMADRVVAHIYNANVRSTMPVEVVSAVRTKTRKGSAVKLRLKIPISQLTALPSAGGYAGKFSVFVVAAGSIGVVSDVVEREQHFVIPAAQIERARQSHYTYDLEVQTDHDADRIAIGVLDHFSKEYGLASLGVES